MTSVTVAVCTHNRAGDVDTCLAALATQAEGAGMPVIVVDSGSDPENAHGLRQSAAIHRAALLRLDEPGLSLARNAAQEQASTDWIAYVDDDAIPAPDWAQKLKLVLESVGEDVAIVGGRITPKWPQGYDATHVTDRWKGLLSCTERVGRGAIADGYNICGANLVVRRAALNRAGRFPTSLGRVGDRLISGEEVFLIERLERLGYTSIYDDAFGVQHCISPQRLNVDWAAERAYWEGVSRIFVLRELAVRPPANLGIAKISASLPVLFAMAKLSGNPDFTIRYNMALGSLVARLGLYGGA